MSGRGKRIVLGRVIQPSEFGGVGLDIWFADLTAAGRWFRRHGAQYPGARVEPFPIRLEARAIAALLNHFGSSI